MRSNPVRAVPEKASANSESGTLWLKIGFDLYVLETLLYCAQ